MKEALNNQVYRRTLLLFSQSLPLSTPVLAYWSNGQSSYDDRNGDYARAPKHIFPLTQTNLFSSTDMSNLPATVTYAESPV